MRRFWHEKLHQIKYCWREKVVMWLAWKMPAWLTYWCAIRVMAYGTCGKYGNTEVPSFLAMDALKRWEDNL